MDWNRMYSQSIAAPYIPRIVDNKDISNFPKFEMDDSNEKLYLLVIYSNILVYKINI